MRQRNLLVGIIAVASAVSCKNTDSTAPQTLRVPTEAHFTLYQPADFSEGAVLNWLSQINNDCSDGTVQGYLPKGTYTITTTIELQILNNCHNPYRVVEIYGAGKDSTLIDIQSTKDCGAGVGFVVYTLNVTIHDLALLGHQNADGSGNCGEGIKFAGDTAKWGMVYQTKETNFGTAAIDVFYADGVGLYNIIDCKDPNGTAAGPNSMGIWVRGTRPSPSAPTGVVSNNTISGCTNESIAIADATYETVESNTIHCETGGYAIGGHSPCSIGIALFGDIQPCDVAPVSNNHVDYNVIYAAFRMDAGIGLEGGGSGHNNLIEHNTVSNAQLHGIQTAPSPCNPPTYPSSPSYTGYSYNNIRANDVSNSLNTQIWIGGNYDSVTTNRYHKGRGLNGIAIAPGTIGVFSSGNVSY